MPVVAVLRAPLSSRKPQSQTRSTNTNHIVTTNDCSDRIANCHILVYLFLDPPSYRFIVLAVNQLLYVTGRALIGQRLGVVAVLTESLLYSRRTLLLGARTPEECHHEEVDGEDDQVTHQPYVQLKQVVTYSTCITTSCQI